MHDFSKPGSLLGTVGNVEVSKASFIVRSSMSKIGVVCKIIYNKNRRKRNYYRGAGRGMLITLLAQGSLRCIFDK